MENSSPPECFHPFEPQFLVVFFWGGTEPRFGDLTQKYYFGDNASIGGCSVEAEKKSAEKLSALFPSSPERPPIQALSPKHCILFSLL